MLDIETLRKLLSYDPETGIFRWLVTRRDRHGRSGKIKAGMIAGSSTHGYRCITINAAHRLAYLYMTERWPKVIDHLNRDRSDNRWRNLREATRRMNCRNKFQYINNTSGFVGIKKRHSYEAYIGTGNRYLGSFKTLAEAVAARRAAEQRYGYSLGHGRRPIRSNLPWSTGERRIPRQQNEEERARFTARQNG